MGKTLEEYYDLVELYRELERCDQEMSMKQKRLSMPYTM